MAQYFEPISGTDGSIVINNYEYPCSKWTYDMVQSNVPISSASSFPYVDQKPGYKNLTLTASGIARKDFNPFVGAKAAYLGKVCNIKCIASQGIGLEPQNATSNALVTRWIWEDNSDGMASWQLTAVGNWEFTNFAQGNA